MKGEMSRAPTWAHATACTKPNIKVRLQVMSSASSSFAAMMPSQVAASLIRTRSLGMPTSSYMAMMRRARRTDCFVSKLRRGSTSVDT